MSHFDDMCSQLRNMGYDVDVLTLKQMNDIFLKACHEYAIDIDGEPLIDSSEMYNADHALEKRFATRYVEYTGMFAPVPIPHVFWVGVKAGDWQSKPVSRYKTNCYAPKQCFMAGTDIVFARHRWSTTYYYVPEYEKRFVQ